MIPFRRIVRSFPFTLGKVHIQPENPPVPTQMGFPSLKRGPGTALATAVASAGHNVPKQHVRNGQEGTMTIAGTGRISGIAAEAARDHIGTAKSTSPEPVSAVAPVEHPPVRRCATRHDAFFVAQLIAVAEHSPQTRTFRRATPQVAQAAYHSAGERSQAGERSGPRLLRVI